MCHGNDCRQEATRLYAISCTRMGWSPLTHNRVLHQALARSLRESKVYLVVEETWPFRERASGQNGSLNPLRMDITLEAVELFRNYLYPRIRRFCSTEGFNDWGGRGYDDFVPGEVTKTAPFGDETT